jgi:tetratricopeptide (TPR) repeat protein
LAFLARSIELGSPPGTCANLVGLKDGTMPKARTLAGIALTLVVTAFLGAPPSAEAAEIRRDPAGKTGISPFWEACKRGDDAHVAGDYPAAIAAFRTAITASPQNPLGHYRLGQSLLASGDLKEAEASYRAGVRFAEVDPTTGGKLLFVLADLEERKGDREAAIRGYDTYLAFLSSHPKVKGHAASAEDRKQKLSSYIKLARDYTAVRDRIALRLKEADSAARKNATP